MFLEPCPFLQHLVAIRAVQRQHPVAHRHGNNSVHGGKGFLFVILAQRRNEHLVGIWCNTIHELLRRELIGICFRILRTSGAAAYAHDFRADHLKQGVTRRGLGAVVSCFVQSDFGERIPFDKFRFPALLKIAGEQVVAIALRKQRADGIIVFARRFFIVVFAVQNRMVTSPESWNTSFFSRMHSSAV